MRGQPFLLMVAWATLVIGDEPFACYWIDGNAVPGLFPCRQTGITMCCDGRDDIKDQCMDNGLCRNSFANGVLAPNDNHFSYWRSGCSDKTWQSKECVALAPCKKVYHLILSEESLTYHYILIGINHSQVRLTECPDGSYCARNTDNAN